MTTAIATMEGPPAAPAPRTPLDSTTLEMVVAAGDLKLLNPPQRVQWYLARCDAAGLDPRTQPFIYVEFEGKLQLYATKSATDQLISNRKITLTLPSRSYDPNTDLYEVLCKAEFPDGQTAEDIGVVSMDGLRGKHAANAVMRAVTKAKRRTVLSSCGLGISDESELDSASRAIRRVSMDEAHGVAIAPPSQKALDPPVEPVEPDVPVPGWDPREADSRPYSRMVADAVASTNGLIANEWGGLPDRPLALEAWVIHKAMVDAALAESRSTGPPPTNAKQARGVAATLYADPTHWNWIRLRVSLACSGYVTAIARLLEAKKAEAAAADLDGPDPDIDFPDEPGSDG